MKEMTKSEVQRQVDARVWNHIQCRIHDRVCIQGYVELIWQVEGEGWNHIQDRLRSHVYNQVGSQIQQDLEQDIQEQI